MEHFKTHMDHVLKDFALNFKVFQVLGESFCRAFLHLQKQLQLIACDFNREGLKNVFFSELCEIFLNFST